MNLFLEKINRNVISFKLILKRNGWKKAKYLKKKKIFKKIGANCYYHSNFLPAEPFLVSIGDNVVIAANVRFVTHSAQHIVFNQEENTNQYKTLFGKITIGNNVFIGANVTIMYGVTIGDNVIIGAGAVVTKDIPSGKVYAGVPAKEISTYDEVKKKNYEFSKKYQNLESRRVIDMYNYDKEIDNNG